MHNPKQRSNAEKITNDNMRVIAKAVADRDGMLVICGDHEAHLKERKESQGKATVPLIVSCPYGRQMQEIPVRHGFKSIGKDKLRLILIYSPPYKDER